MSNMIRQRRITFIDQAARISNAVKRADLLLVGGATASVTISRRAKTTLLDNLSETEKRLFGDNTTSRAPSSIIARRQSSLLTRLAMLETQARHLNLI